MIEFSSLDSLLVPKILFRLPARSLSSSAWRMTLPPYSCSYYSPPDPFWYSFLSSALTSKGINHNFLIFFLCLTWSSSSLSDSYDGSQLAFSSSYCLPFLILFPLALALEGHFSTILLVRSTNMDISVSAKSYNNKSKNNISR